MLTTGLILIILGWLEGCWVNSYLGPEMHFSERPDILRRGPLLSLFFSSLWILLVLAGLILVFLSSLTAGIWAIILLLAVWILGLHLALYNLFFVVLWRAKTAFLRK